MENIAGKEVDKRRVMGYGSLTVAAGMVWWSLLTGQPMWVRACVFVPTFFGFMGLLQARRRTCVVLAAVGQQCFLEGTEPVEDPEVRDQLRAAGFKLAAQAAVLAGVVTAVTLLL